MIDVRARSGRPRWYVEAPALVVGYLLFGLARAALTGSEAAATHNAVALQRVERALHVAVERPVNAWLVAEPALGQAAGWFYRLSVLAVPVVLVGVYVARPGEYRRLRTVLVVLTVADLPLVALVPLSPPRFSQPGVVDVLTTLDVLGGMRPRPGLNSFAAMPSMHVAWTAWCAWATWSVLRTSRPWPARLGWLLPVVTSVVVVATGNHYVLDVVGGGILVATAVLGGRRVGRS